MIYKLKVKRWPDDTLSIIEKEKTALKVQQNWYPGRVRWENDTIEDAVLALNKHHGLQKALWNWETTTKIELMEGK